MLSEKAIAFVLDLEAVYSRMSVSKCESPRTCCWGQGRQGRAGLPRKHGQALLLSSFDRAVLPEGDLGDGPGLHLCKGLRPGLASANTLQA